MALASWNELPPNDLALSVGKRTMTSDVHRINHEMLDSRVRRSARTGGLR